ncbi:MAG: hypothetical protein HC875_38465 [Anaerolineales bacterium]|nr:hypothetical protein [Anaerolineales bacterium]
MIDQRRGGPVNQRRQLVVIAAFFDSVKPVAADTEAKEIVLLLADLRPEDQAVGVVDRPGEAGRGLQQKIGGQGLLGVVIVDCAGGGFEFKAVLAGVGVVTATPILLGFIADQAAGRVAEIVGKEFVGKVRRGRPAWALLTPEMRMSKL